MMSFAEAILFIVAPQAEAWGLEFGRDSYVRQSKSFYIL